MRKISKICLLIVFSFIVCCGVFAQNIGINSIGATPDNSAILDISATNKGLLIPRVSLVSTSDAATIPNPATSLLIWNTNPSVAGGVGYYYNSGTTASPVWVRLVTAGELNTGWSLTGNIGTVDGTNFIGTTDNKPFNIRVNNQKAGRIDSTSGNTSYGYQSLNSNTTGSQNTVSGYDAMFFNTVGSRNIAIGANALNANRAGSGGVAIGAEAMRYASSRTTAFANYNTAVGDGALRGSENPTNNTGNFNTVIGRDAMRFNTSGSYNSVKGVQALYYNTTGSQNTVSGYDAMFSNTIGSRNIAIGMNALNSNRAGSGAVAIGTEAMRYVNNRVTAFDNYNTAVGHHALRGSGNPAVNTGNSNTVIGYQGLYSNSSGEGNAAIGYQVLYSNTSGGYNAAIGQHALYRNTTGVSNAATGYVALYSNTTGYSNTATGTSALYSNVNGFNNSGFGMEALVANTSGHSNTAAGFQALHANTSGRNNAAFGVQSLTAVTTGVDNSALGFAAGPTGNFNNSTAIGARAQVGDSNSIVLGSINGINGATATVNVGIGTISPTQRLDIDGQIRIRGGAPGVGKILTSDANGVATWETPATGGGTLNYAYNFGGAGAGRVISANTGAVEINKTIQRQSNLIISGQEYYQSGNAGSGIAIMAGVNRNNNKQLWITDQDDISTPNATNPVVRIMLTSTNGAIDAIATDGNTLLPLVLQGGGNRVGIGRAPTNNILEVNGNASKAAAGDWVANSDQRLKKNISTISTGFALQKIMQLRGVTYEWNDDKTGYNRPAGTQYGFIAQEIQEVFPEKVSEDAQGYLQTAYGDYDPLYIQAFKELVDEINALKTENETLKTQINLFRDIECRMKALEQHFYSTSLTDRRDPFTDEQ